ncbi:MULTISPECIES: alginate O-acetyltransferase AlgX-related protein [unclassified Microbacterium]|uniref:alginate O-acetyltransferase AlgX-related protein n=1 Tax=unclassified Microbacterium TaxID=2609290 RepID=UPI003439C052
MTAPGVPVHGAQIPSPVWWRRYRNIPLAILTVLSLVAAIVGWTVQHQLDSSNNAAAPVPGSGETSVDGAMAACRQPVDLPSQNPWVDDPAGAEAAWKAQADQLAGPVIEGRDGWYFYNDQIEQNFSQAIGRRLLTVSELSKWTDYFTSIDEALEDQGIELSIQITPSATSVYPEKLPEWAEELRGPTPLDQLLLATPDLPIVDFRADLRTAAADDAVYTPVNSHWTDWGGYIGWQTFAACHAELYPDNPPVVVPAVTGTKDTGTFNEYAQYGVADTTPSWNAPVFAETLPEVKVVDNKEETKVVSGTTPVDLLALPATTLNDASASPQKALILRDSMGGALSPFWNQQYAQTWQLQHRYDDWSNPPNYASLVNQYKPDVVIIQLAERHLVNAPPGTSGF